jgi:LuxR family transcriptional regulator, quorum-sensing system regulator SdiA
MLQDMQEHVIERELSRAINRTDFFRAFKMHAKYYDLGSFLVFRLSGFAAESALSRLCTLADMSSEAVAALEQMNVQDHYALLTSLAALRKPRILLESETPLGKIFEAARLIVIPAIAEGGEKFVLLLGDARLNREETEMVNLVYDFSNALRRFSDSEGLDTEAPKFRKREIEVIEWTAEGKTSADIAIILGLSEYTVNEYIASAMKKLDAVNRIHLVTKAIRLGVVA